MKWSAIVVGMVAVALADPAEAARPAATTPAPTTAPPTKSIELESNIMPAWSDLGTSKYTKKIRLARVFLWWSALESRDKKAIKALYTARADRNAANDKVDNFFDGAKTCLRKQKEYKRKTRTQIETALAEVAACIKENVKTPTFTVLASQSLPADFYDTPSIDFGGDNDEDEGDDDEDDEEESPAYSPTTATYATSSPTMTPAPTAPVTTAPLAVTTTPYSTTAAPEATTAAPQPTTTAPEATTAAPEATTATPYDTTAPDVTPAVPDATTATPYETTAGPETITEPESTTATPYAEPEATTATPYTEPEATTATPYETNTEPESTTASPYETPTSGDSPTSTTTDAAPYSSDESVSSSTTAPDATTSSTDDTNANYSSPTDDDTAVKDAAAREDITTARDDATPEDDKTTDDDATEEDDTTENVDAEEGEDAATENNTTEEEDAATENDAPVGEEGAKNEMDEVPPAETSEKDPSEENPTASNSEPGEYGGGSDYDTSATPPENQSGEPAGYSGETESPQEEEPHGDVRNPFSGSAAGYGGGYGEPAEYGETAGYSGDQNDTTGDDSWMSPFSGGWTGSETTGYGQPTTYGGEPEYPQHDETVDGNWKNPAFPAWDTTDTPQSATTYGLSTDGAATSSWLMNQWNFSPASPDVPPMWALDLDHSSSVDEKEWEAYIARLRGLATKAATTGRDATGVELLQNAINFHYGMLTGCIRKRVQEESGSELNDAQFNRVARWVEDHCNVKFRYSVFAGVPPFEWVARDRESVSASDIEVWFTNKVEQARDDVQVKRAITVAPEHEALIEKFIECVYGTLKPAGDDPVTRDVYYSALHQIEDCAAN